jgi:glycosyltransferase involved in cell wall biosynthesis
MYKGRKVCVIIPALNEEATIQTVVKAMPDFVDNVVVVDDGSTDKTSQLAREAGALVCRHQKNKGLGVAFRTGIYKALELQADIACNIDADGQFNPKDIATLVEPVATGQAGFVTASRFADPSFYPEMTRIKFYGNLMMAWLISRIVGRRFYDVSCGFRAYSREVIFKLNLFGTFTYTQEAFIDLAFKDVDMLEIPVRVRGIREFGKSRIASNLFKYAYNTMKIIVRVVRDHRAMRVFGLAALLFAVLGLALGGFFVGYFLLTGGFGPHKWAAFSGGFSLTIAMLLFIIGFVTDMLSRIRKNQEEILVYLKRAQYDGKPLPLVESSTSGVRSA